MNDGWISGPCIGGPNDGEWHSLKLEPWQNHILLQERAPLGLPSEHFDPAMAITNISRYEREQIRTPKQDFHFWRFSEMKIEQALDKLLRAYKARSG